MDLTNKRRKAEYQDLFVEFPPVRTTDFTISINLPTHRVNYKVHRNILQQEAPKLTCAEERQLIKYEPVFECLMCFIYRVPFNLTSPVGLAQLYGASIEFQILGLQPLCTSLFWQWKKSAKIGSADLRDPFFFSKHNDSQQSSEQALFPFPQQDALKIVCILSEFYSATKPELAEIIDGFVEIANVEADLDYLSSNIHSGLLLCKIVKNSLKERISGKFFLKAASCLKHQLSMDQMVELLASTLSFNDEEMSQLLQLFPSNSRSPKIETWVSYFTQLNTEEQLICAEEKLLFL